MTTVKITPLAKKVDEIEVGDYVYGIKTIGVKVTSDVYMVVEENTATYNLIKLDGKNKECVPKRNVCKFYGTITITIEK